MNQQFLALVRQKAKQRLLFLPHATRQMMRPERMISTAEIRGVVLGGEVIEDYPEDARGHSCLMCGYGDNARGLHVVCAPKDEYLAIITAYLPNSSQWSADFKSRRK